MRDKDLENCVTPRYQRLLFRVKRNRFASLYCTYKFENKKANYYDTAIEKHHIIMGLMVYQIFYLGLVASCVVAVRAIEWNAVLHVCVVDWVD